MTAKTDSTTEGAVTPMLNQREVAALFGVSLRTVATWRERGILVGTKIGGVLRFRRADVLALMDNPGTQ